MNDVMVNVKKLDPQAVIPTYATNGSAGLDLTAISVEYKKDIDCFVYHTGLALEIPKGYVGLLFPRSSNRKTEAYLTNSVGVIDSDYRGDIMISYKNRDFGGIMPYQLGDKVAQLIIVPYPTITFNEVFSLSETVRGEGGHGSTGK